MVQKRKKQAAFERDARNLGIVSGEIDRSNLLHRPAAVDYRAEAGLSGKRPLPVAIRDGTWQSLAAASELDAVYAPALRFIGTFAIADALGISPRTLNEHKKKPGFPHWALRHVEWLMVADIDGIAAIEGWLRKRRVGQSKNHIRRRGPDGRARRGGR